MAVKQLADWANYAYQTAVQAGEKIMHYYPQVKSLETEFKADASPLTIADKASHDIIYQALKDYSLDAQGPAPLLSEEGEHPPYLDRQQWQRYWCIDPLDGTKEFLKGIDEFTVNIALIMDHEPVVGVIYVPAQQMGYLAWRGGGAYRCNANGERQRIVTQSPVLQPLRVLTSRHHGLENLSLLKNLGETRIMQQGSALKFGTVAEGGADLFLRLSQASEWDNAAGQCLLEEAGGAIFGFNLQPLRYNLSDNLKQGSFVAVGDKLHNWSQYFAHK